MFGKTHKKIYAPADGTAVPLDSVPHEFFLSRGMGKGFAVEPISGNVYSPVSGTVTEISRAKQEYALKSPDGVEVRVCVGVGTANLGGKGFVPMVGVLDNVTAGDILVRAELSSIRAAGLDPVIPVIISNPERCADIRVKYGSTRGGRTVSATYTAQKKGKT